MRKTKCCKSTSPKKRGSKARTLKRKEKERERERDRERRREAGFIAQLLL